MNSSNKDAPKKVEKSEHGYKYKITGTIKGPFQKLPNVANQFFLIPSVMFTILALAALAIFFAVLLLP